MSDRSHEECHRQTQYARCHGRQPFCFALFYINVAYTNTRQIHPSIFCNLCLKICYGTTENSPVTFQSHLTTPLEKRVSTVGRVSPHTEAKVVDSEGKVVPANTAGELCIRGYSVMLNYWEDDAKTKEVISEDRWYKTG